MYPNEMTFGDVVIGPGQPPVFLAELGAMFNQDVDLALSLIDQVAEAKKGITEIPVMVKGEILHDPSCCLDDGALVSYRSKSGEAKTERYRDLIERKVLPLAAYERIIGACRDREIQVVMSVYDETGAAFAVEQGVVALKTNSGNITNRPLLRAVAKFNQPMIIDTGRSALGEVEAAINIARTAGNERLIIQHSPDGHPAAPEDHHLRAINTIQRAFNVLTGLSCHSSGTDSLFIALALGASILEKNIVWDDTLLEQDYAISMGIDAFRGILARIETAWLTLGAPFRDVRRFEGLDDPRTRYGLIADSDIASGEILNTKNVRTAFPCKGIPAARYDDVMGWKARTNLQSGTPIGWFDVEP